MKKKNSTYFIDSSLSDYDYLVLDNLSNLNEEHDKTFKEDEKVSDSVYFHGSVEDIEGYLNNPINWITKDFDYAKTFALDNGYVYECSANLGNLLDVGKTDARVFDMIPSTPLKFSREFTAIIRKLNISEDSIRRIIDNVADEYKVNPYRLAIRPVIRSMAFKRILEGLGFDGVRAVEYDSVNNKDVETFGLFDRVKVLDKVNEELIEKLVNSRSGNDVYITTSPYEVKNYIFNQKTSTTRIVWIRSEEDANAYGYGNGYNLIHGDIEEVMLGYFYFPDEDDLPNEMFYDVSLIFIPNDCSGEKLGDEKGCFIRPQGYFIEYDFAEGRLLCDSLDFEKSSLYSVLSNDIIDKKVDESLDEEYEIKDTLSGEIIGVKSLKDAQDYINKRIAKYKKGYTTRRYTQPGIDVVCKKEGNKFILVLKESLTDEELKEYFEEIPDEGESYRGYATLNDCPIYATDETYKVKSMLENSSVPYRILLTHRGMFLVQDARGNKTHYDMARKAAQEGYYDEESDWYDDESYMVFFPTDFKGEIRWHTTLGEDSYYSCRVYPCGVIFVRDAYAYENKLFDALGNPKREIYYNYDDGQVTIIENGEEVVLDVHSDLNGEPNNAIDFDFSEARGADSTEKVKELPEIVEIKITRLDDGMTYDKFKTLDNEEVYDLIERYFMEHEIGTTPEDFTWGNSPTTIFVRDIVWSTEESLEESEDSESLEDKFYRWQVGGEDFNTIFSEEDVEYMRSHLTTINSPIYRCEMLSDNNNRNLDVGDTITFDRLRSFSKSKEGFYDVMFMWDDAVESEDDDVICFKTKGPVKVFDVESEFNLDYPKAFDDFGDSLNTQAEIFVEGTFKVVKKGTIYDDYIETKHVLLTLEQVDSNFEESLDEEKAITWGDLDYAQKTDTRRMMSGRGTGHFGTGFYFVGKEGPYGLDKDNNIKGYDYEPSRPIYEIDLDKYNLYKPKDNDSAYRLHDAMASINNYYSPDMNKFLFSNTDVDELIDSFYSAVAGTLSFDEDVDDDDFDMEELDAIFSSKDDDSYEDDTLDDEEPQEEKGADKYLEKAKEWIENNGLTDWINTGYDDLDTWLDKNKNKLGLIEDEVVKAINNRDKYIGYVEYAIDVLCKVFNTDRNTLMAMCKAFYNMKSEDSISTLLFKEFGYEGVDVTHLNHDAQGLSGLDNFGYGTVVYDLKPGTFKKIVEPRENGSIHSKSGSGKSKASEDLNEYFDSIEDSGESYGGKYATVNDCPIYVTDETYKVKALIEKGDKPYRILLLDSGNYLVQDARGNKTHWDMYIKARKLGYVEPSDDYNDESYMVFIPINFNGQLRWHTRLGTDAYDSCRVYSFGVMFVRDSTAYTNNLFQALGDPEREVYYDTFKKNVTIVKGDTKKVVDVGDLCGEPNNAITQQVE